MKFGDSNDFTVGANSYPGSYILNVVANLIENFTFFHLMRMASYYAYVLRHHIMHKSLVVSTLCLCS